MKATFTTIDEYLAGLPDETRARLERLRAAVHAIVPGAEECISYGMPGFRAHGKVFIGFAATVANHSVYPHSGNIIPQCAKDLEGYDTSSGAIRVPPGTDLPARLLRKLIRLRLDEIRSAPAARLSRRR